MVFPRWYWFKRFIRNNTSPIPETKALLWSRRLRIAYNVLAFNALGLVLFACLNGQADWAEYHGLKSKEEMELSPGQQWAKTLGKKNVDIYRVSGFTLTKVQSYSEVQEKNNSNDVASQ